MKPFPFSLFGRFIVFASFLWITTFFSGTVSAQSNITTIRGYGKATYNASVTGKFMKNWLIAGPVSVSSDTMPGDVAQQAAFKEDLVTTINVNAGKPVTPIHVKQDELQWKTVSSAADEVILDKVFGEQQRDFVYAYALAEIKAEKAGTVILGLGSDDAVKVWLNGKLIHENFIPRAVNKDDDIVPLQLEKGSNQLLLKVQDMQGGWGFIARLLDKSAMGEQLSTAAGKGDLDKINMLVQSGADINAKNSNGITALVAAKIAGRADVVDLLLKKGAKEEGVPSPESLVDTYYATLKNKEAPGIAVLVSQDGEVLYEKGYGYADIKGKKLITPNTKFRIGSVTKQFTAAAILKLQEEGKINVNDKLSKYIPDFPRGNEVTIHQLLTHTSGIHSYTNKADFIEKVTKTISEDSLINSFKNDPYDFEPGTNLLYNNSGYFLLGYIIGKVSGKPYAQYLKETFFEPLHMNNTGVHFAGIRLEEEAHGYGKENGKYTDAINWDMSWAGGAGALYSTLEDLDTWNKALYSGKVISESSLKAALTPAKLKNGEIHPMNYGYGLITGSYRGIDFVQHGGGLHGFVTQLAYYPKQKLSVVMFSNNMEPEFNFDPNKIAEAFLWNSMEKQASSKEVTVPAEVLNRYTGRYDFMSSGVMQISVEDNKLWAQLPGQGKFQIFPSSQNEFFWKVVDAKIKFIQDENGVVNHAEFSQNGQNLNVKKLKEEQIITLDPAIIDLFLGKFKASNGMVLTITTEKDKIFIQPNGQPRFEMLPLSSTEFTVKEFNARLTFSKEDSGKVNKLKLSLNGSDSEFSRIE